jgi:putative ABC transport system permease protein
MIGQDLRYGLRILVKNPGISLLIIFTLALGVGVNTAMFSIVNSLLLRPLPVPEPQQLVVMVEQLKGANDLTNISYADYLDFRHQSGALVDMAAYQISQVGLSSEGQPERAVVNYVTGNFFSMLGVKPETGRLIFEPEGDQPGADPVLVLGYGYWQKRFHGDPGIAGKTVVVNGHVLTVLGVAEKDFHGVYALAEADAYIPISMAAIRTVIGGAPNDFWTKRDARNLKVVGRLKEGAALSQVQASLNVIAHQLAQQFPDTNKDLGVLLFPERFARPEPSQSNILPMVASIFLLLAAIVLLVACVNVANILLVRSVGRQKEMGIRAALGAGHSRLFTQCLTESLLVATLGGIAGIFLGEWACGLLQSIKSHIEFPVYLNFSLDWRVFAYSFSLALVTGVIVGILPALRASRSNVNDVLRQSGRSISSGIWQRRLRSALVLGQIASSLVLLVVAGLFLRSLQKAKNMDLGFDPDQVVNLSMDPHLIGYEDTLTTTFYRELESRVQAIPGVKSASLSFSVPFGFLHESARVYAAGHSFDGGQLPPEVIYNTVDPNYFDNLKIPLGTGRLFTDEDTASKVQVAVINETMAKQFWPGQNAIGKRFALGSPTADQLQVIGITRDGKYLEPSEETEPYFFVPMAQHFVSFRTLQVRTSVPPESVVPQIRQLIKSLSPDLPVFDVRTMKDALNGFNGFFFFKLGAGLATAFGLLGLALAVVGVYGVVSFTVTQRTQEIGIRMAMGARRDQILKMILRQGFVVIALGIVTGVIVAFVIGQAMKNLLVGISATDPLTFVSISAFLAVVALMASVAPAIRASRIDPIITLRIE